MIADVTFEKTVFQHPPNRFEAGTGNIADAVGLGAALDYVTRIGLETIARYEHLTTYNGLPTRKKLEMLSVEKGLPKGLHTAINHIKQKYTREEILRQCVPVFEKEFMPPW